MKTHINLLKKILFPLHSLFIKFMCISGGTRADISGQLSRWSVHYVCHKSSCSWQDSVRLRENLKGKHEALSFLDRKPNIRQPLHTKIHQWFSSIEANTHTKLTGHFQSSVCIRKLGQRAQGSQEVQLLLVFFHSLHFLWGPLPFSFTHKAISNISPTHSFRIKGNSSSYSVLSWIEI